MQLVTAGTVLRRADSNSPERWTCRYRVRVDGRVIQRAIYIGPAVLAKRAQTLIEKWREEAVTPEERRRRSLLRTWDETAQAFGFSHMARDRVRAAGQLALGNPAAELRLTYEIRDPTSPLRRGRPPGRPAKSQLW